MKLSEKIEKLKGKLGKLFEKKEENEYDKGINNIRVQNVKNKKYSLQKVKTIGLTICLAGALFLGACAKDINTVSNQKYDNNQVTQTEYTEIYDTSDISGKKEVSIDNYTQITYDDSAYDNFNEFIESYNVSFDTLDEMYDIDEAVETISADRKEIVNHKYSGFIENGKVNESKLLESVISNSPTYKKENKNKCLFYSVIEDKTTLKNIISIIAKAINEDLPSKTEEDIKELDCTLGSLRIFSTTGLSAAAITDDNVLLINEPMIEMLKINSGNEDGLLHTIYHETKHLEQVSCNDYDNELYEYQGVSVKSDNLEKNPFSWTWLLEGSAEKGTTNEIGGNDESYLHLIGYVETLDLTSITSSLNNDGNAIEDTTFNKKINEFYELLGTNNGITKKEVIEMMYAMEVVQKRVNTFQDDYKNTYGVELSDNDYLEIRHQLRRDFLLEVSKIFYSNLASSINNRNDVTLEDVFSLITIFEGDLNYHLEYSTNSSITDDEKDKEFLQEYEKIQEAFFSSLTICNNIEYNDIIARLEEYGLYVENTDKSTINATLTWVNDEKKEWLIEKANGERMLYGFSINKISSELSNLKSK